MNENSTKGQEIDLAKFNQLGINTKVKSFPAFYESGLLNNIDEKFLTDVHVYWKKYYREEKNPAEHPFYTAYMNFTGDKDPRIVSPTIMSKEIVPYLNDPKMREAYSDKNIYDILLDTQRTTELVLKRVYETYYDAKNNYLSRESAYQQLKDYASDLIIKPSKTDDGEGIEKLTYHNKELYIDEKKVSMQEIEEIYGGHFIVQKVVEQHDIMAAPHPSSVNTLRVVTLRWKGKVRYLLTFARFGVNQSVKDNAGAGGICLGVTDTGEFYNVAVDSNCKRYTHHPTTNYRFADLPPIPNFSEFKEFAIELHNQILHHDFVSWDIIVGKDSKPIFLEANFKGAVWLYQLATERPLFGDLTEEILQHIGSEIDSRRSSRTKVIKEEEKRKQELSRLRRKVRKLRRKNKQLRTKLNESND